MEHSPVGEVDLAQELRADVIDRSASGGDMKAHMMRLFDEVMARRPLLMVELGIRDGISSFALERAAMLCEAAMVCVDQNDCSGVLGYAEFVQADDVEFAARFPYFCEERAVFPRIDFLMIDTEQTYEQTKREVEAWLPFMAHRCVLVFHDTNAQPLYDGVARFLREWLRIPFPENLEFHSRSTTWEIEHHPECYGLTILRRG